MGDKPKLRGMNVGKRLVGKRRGTKRDDRKIKREEGSREYEQNAKGYI